MTESLAERIKAAVERYLECFREGLLETSQYHDVFCDGWTSDHKKRVEEIIGRSISDQAMAEVWKNTRIEIEHNYYSRDDAIDVICLYHAQAEIVIELLIFPDNLIEEIKALDPFTLKNLSEEVELPLAEILGDGEFYMHEEYGITPQLVINDDFLAELKKIPMELITYDVTGGIVNQAYNSGLNYYLSENCDDIDIIRFLKRHHIIPLRAQFKSIKIDGEYGYTIYISYRGKPLAELRPRE